jgi:hypothetical protein
MRQLLVEGAAATCELHAMAYDDSVQGSRFAPTVLENMLTHSQQQTTKFDAAVLRLSMKLPYR